MIHSVLRILADIKLQLYKYLFALFRIQSDKVVFFFVCYSCNPKAIAEEIIHKTLPYRLVWLSDYDIPDLPSSISYIRKSGFWGAFHLATAKVIVMNSKGDKIRYIKKTGQYLIQTCHGSFPLKYVEAECVDKLPPEYVKNSMADSKLTNLVLSDGKWTSCFIRRALWYNGEIMEKGYPRNDIYFKASISDIVETKKKLGIDHKKRIVIYAPTFRDNGEMSCYGLDGDALLQRLKEKTGESWCLLVRSHPNLFGKALPFAYTDDIIDVTRYADAQQLFLIADLLITDYSSIMIDFLLMKKPVLLFATDESTYIQQRGIRPEYYQLPFPHSKDNEELLENLQKLDMKHPYSDDFMLNYGSKDDGHAAEYVVERILLEAPLTK